MVVLAVSFLVGYLNVPAGRAEQPLPALVEKAGIYYQSGKYPEAIAIWEQLLANSASDLPALHSNLAVAYFQVGNFGAAIRHWEKVIQIYREKGDLESRQALAESLADQAQAYNALGRFQLAIPQITEAIQLTGEMQEVQTEVAAYRILGDSYVLAGELASAIEAYSKSLELATQLHRADSITTALNSLSHVYQERSRFFAQQAALARQEEELSEAERWSKLADSDRNRALDWARRAVKAGQGSGGLSEAQARIGLMRLSSDAAGSQAVLLMLNSLPDSGGKVHALIKLAEGLAGTEKVKALERAIEMARRLGDHRTESFALGTLGRYYEAQGQYNQALSLTQKAQLAAQEVQATDSLYQWQWQAGRLYRALGNSEGAIAAYRGSVNSLEQMRGAIAASSRELQLDVREEVEPVYRELLALLLAEDSQAQIQEALATQERLQLTELQDFFKDECVGLSESRSFEGVLAKTNTAAIHSLILPQKTYLILQLADGTAHRYAINLNANQLKTKVQSWRRQLENPETDEYLTLSRELYQLFIRPLEAELGAANPSQLVFINDGILRNVPMAALHDGRQFFIEKYPLAASLGLNFIAPQRSPKNLRSLTFGLTVAIPPFAALPNVKRETEAVTQILGGSRFLDEEFTAQNLQRRVRKEKFPVLHLATHGKFGGTLDSIFLQSYEGKIDSATLEKILSQSRSPIELLTLSACQTAAGNERSVLGLAGVAARSGVKTTLGTLWFINDAATVPLIADFYQSLQQPGMTKAEALRQAQLKQIREYKTPAAIWSSFVLIGNWL